MFSTNFIELKMINWPFNVLNKVKIISGYSVKNKCLLLS